MSHETSEFDATALKWEHASLKARDEFETFLDRLNAHEDAEEALLDHRLT